MAPDAVIIVDTNRQLEISRDLTRLEERGIRLIYLDGGKDMVQPDFKTVVLDSTDFRPL
jgi:hypothetical protein